MQMRGNRGHHKLAYTIAHSGDVPIELSPASMSVSLHNVTLQRFQMSEFAKQAALPVAAVRRVAWSRRTTRRRGVSATARDRLPRGDGRTYSSVRVRVLHRPADARTIIHDLRGSREATSEASRCRVGECAVSIDTGARRSLGTRERRGDRRLV